MDFVFLGIVGHVTVRIVYFKLPENGQKTDGRILEVNLTVALV